MNACSRGAIHYLHDDGKADVTVRLQVDGLVEILYHARRRGQSQFVDVDLAGHEVRVAPLVMEITYCWWGLEILAITASGAGLASMPPG